MVDRVKDVILRRLPPMIAGLALENMTLDKQMETVKSCDTAEQILSAAFFYGDTRQGFDFWLGIEERLRYQQPIPNEIDPIQRAMMMGSEAWGRFQCMSGEYAVEWQTPLGDNCDIFSIIRIDFEHRSIWFNSVTGSDELRTETEGVKIISIKPYVKNKRMETIKKPLFELISELPRIYFDLIIKELRLIFPGEAFYNAMRVEYENVSAAIAESFNWSATTQGDDFWRHLHHEVYHNAIRTQFDAIELVQILGVAETYRFSLCKKDVFYIVTWEYKGRQFIQKMRVERYDRIARIITFKEYNNQSDDSDSDGRLNSVDVNILSIQPEFPIVTKKEKEAEPKKDKNAEHKTKHRRTVFTSAMNTLSHISLREETKIVVNPKILQDLKAFLAEKKLYEDCQICNEKERVELTVKNNGTGVRYNFEGGTWKWTDDFEQTSST